jgi:TRAP-type C4-dicarboxylate transport system substrate-binding protein
MYKVIKIIFILFFLSIPVMSPAETKVIKIVFLGNLADEDYDGSLVFKNYVESHSYGKLKVEIYPGAQLCGCAIECLMALKAGIIEIYKI